MILVALFGPYLWTIDPNAPTYDRLLGARAGRTRWAPTTSAATRSPASSPAPRSRSRSARIAIAIALVFGALIGLLAGFYRGPLDLLLMRVVDIALRVPGADPRAS